MWKWNLDWPKKYWFCFYFFLLLGSFAEANPLKPSFLGERHSKRIQEYAKLSYTFSTEGGEKSLKIGECRKVVVSVKKGALPVAGKNVGVTFSRMVAMAHDDESETIVDDHFEKATDYLGQIRFCFAGQKTGPLEVLFFFLDSTHGHSQHLSRLYYEIYDANKASVAFFLPFGLLFLLAFYILTQMCVVTFFSGWAYDFVSLASPASWVKRWRADTIMRFLLTHKPSLRFLFPVLWCHPDQLGLDGNKNPAQFANKNFLEQVIFSLAALAWVLLYGYFPSVALLLLLLLYRDKRFSCFCLFAFIQMLFLLGLPSSGVSVEYLHDLVSKDFFYAMIIFAFFFPFPQIWLGFLLLVLQSDEPQWASKMLSWDFAFLQSAEWPLIFVWARVFLILFCVSSAGTLNLYGYRQQKRKIVKPI